MLEEERWRERCERYFSSITDVRKDSDTAGPADLSNHKKKDKDGKKKNKSKKAAPQKQTNVNVNNVLSTATAAAAERTTKQTTKKTTMKKTTEDRVIIRANGKAYRTKQRPFKGPRRWLSSLDLHGTSMLQRTESVLFFLVWILITLAGCAVFGYLLYLVVDDFLDDSSHFRVMVGAGFDLSLAVSVCNINPLRKSHLSSTRFAGLSRLNISALSTNYQQVRPADIELLLQRTQLQRFVESQHYSHLNLMALLEELQGEYPVYGSMMTEEDWDNLYASSLRSGHYDVFARALRMTPMEMSSLGHHMQASMLQCLKNGHACDSQDVTYPRVLDYGNCATIDLTTDSANWFDSLSLIYDAEPEEYVDYLSSSRGMRVFLHTPQGGFWRSTAFMAPVGSVLKLHVTKATEIEKLSSKCREGAGYNYNQCLQSCLEEETRSVCGCSRSVSATLNRKCRPNVQYEYLCYRTLEILAKMDQLQCNCPSNCREQQFDVQVSQVQWPTRIYENHLRKSLLQKGIIKNYPSLRDSLAKIEVSLGHTQRVLMTEEEDTTWLQLMVQIGALSALTVGISMVTGVEILWLIGRLFCQCIRAAWRGRRAENQVKAMSTASCPEFDDLGFNWSSLQAQEGERPNTRSGAMATDTTDLTPPLGPNLLLGLDPIVEENDVDIRAVDGAEETNLYTHAWERSGQSRPYSRVLVSGKDANISDAPLLNAPGHNTSLRGEMYRPSSDSLPGAAGAGPSSLPYGGSSGRAPVGSDKPPAAARSSGGGNYILKSRAPYTWHSAHYGGASQRQAVMTPADFINVYGQPARRLYEDEDTSAGFYLP